MASLWHAANLTALSASPESPDTFGKIANVGALGTVAVVALIGLTLITLVVMLIGWAGVLADFQSRGGALRTVIWVALVLCLPIVGTVAWVLFGRRTGAPEKQSIDRGQNTFRHDDLQSASVMHNVRAA